MAALLTSVLDSTTKVAEYIAACKDMGIRLLPPDVNESDADFTVVGDDLRFGLAAIKGIGRGFVHAVMRERERNGAFLGFEEFCRRMAGQELNRRVLESLIRAGCFDSLGYKRRALLQVHEKVLSSVTADARANVAGQMDLFGGGAEEQSALPGEMELPDVEEFSRREKLAMEREVAGLYLSGHPMDEFTPLARKAGATRTIEILSALSPENEGGSLRDGQRVTVAGIVVSTRTRTTKSNTLMNDIRLEDDSGAIGVIAFQKVLDQSGGYIRQNEPLLITGRISARDDREPELVADTIEPLTEETVRAHQKPEPRRPQQSQPQPQNDAARRIWVRLPNREDWRVHRIELILQMFPGRQQLILYFEDTKKRAAAPCLIHEALVDELIELCGAENVVVKS
jgi:DNA polymerase-3 subunit alpha